MGLGLAAGIGGFNKNSLPHRFSPLSIGGCVAWYDFSDQGHVWEDLDRTIHPVTNGRPVKLVDNKAFYHGVLKGSSTCIGKAMVSNSVGSTPTFSLGAGVEKCVTFDGSDDFMHARPGLATTEVSLNLLSSTNLGMSNTTVFFVIKSDANTGDNNTCSWSFKDDDTDMFAAELLSNRWNMTSKQNSPRLTKQEDSNVALTSNIELWTMHIDSGTDSSFYRNGNTAHGFTDGDTTNGTIDLDQNHADTCFRAGCDPAEGDFFDGNIYHIVIYKSALSAANITKVENYFKARYGV